MEMATEAATATSNNDLPKASRRLSNGNLRDNIYYYRSSQKYLQHRHCEPTWGEAIYHEIVAEIE
jgi:hypothetical protein